MADIYYAVLGLKALGQRPSDVARVLKNVQSALKRDDSAARLVYFFYGFLNISGYSQQIS